MTNNSVEAMIALRIIQAQASSDAGKGLNRLSLEPDKARPCEVLKYSFKVKPILEAIKLIRTNKTHFNYWVEESPDQNGYDSIIVYFDFKINGSRYQVSFHNPLNTSGELKKYISTGRKTRWNKNLGGSFDACQELQRYYSIPRSDIEMLDDEIVQRDHNRRGNNRRRWERRF